MSKLFDIKNKAGESVDIYVYGEILSGSYKWDESDVVFKDFIDAIDGIEPGQEINLYINSPGGSCFATQGIIAYLKRAQDKGHVINATIDGLGASCASFLPFIADNVYVYESSMFMFHKPWSYGAGNANDFRGLIDLLDILEDNFMMPLYESRLKDPADKDKLKAIVANETWMSARDAAELFNITILEDDKEFFACVQDEKVFKQYQNTPQSVLNSVKTIENEERPELPTPEPENKAIKDQAEITKAKAKLMMEVTMASVRKDVC